MTETELTQRCIKWARAEYPDGLFVKVHVGGWSMKGFPDVLAFLRGRFAAIELKDDGEGYGQQEDQKVWQRRFERAGATYVLAVGAEAFKEAVGSIADGES